MHICACFVTYTYFKYLYNMAIYLTYVDCSRIVYFSAIGSINDIQIIDDYDNFDSVNYEFSWSLDDATWSIYMTKSDMLSNLDSMNIFVDVNVYIRIKFSLTKSKSLQQSYYELTSVKINTIDVRPISIEAITDSDILNTSNSKNLFNPYRNFDSQKILYAKMSKSISDIFGFDSVYFKTEPLIDTEDITFRSYRLANVTEYKSLQVVINNNELPDNKLRFSEYDIDFQDELELHIVKEVFEEQFGSVIPNSNDFLYLPLTDRMYQINTIYEAKEFMNYGTYYKTILVKYENRASVLKDIDITDKLNEYVDFEHDFEHDKLEGELLDAVKQYNEVKFDDNQNFISDNQLTINDYDVIKWTYDYSALPATVARTYDVQLLNNIYGLVFWFNITTDSVNIVELLNTDNSFLIIRYNVISKRFSVSMIANGLSITEQFTSSSDIEASIYYGFVLNYSEVSQTLTCSIINSELIIVQQIVMSDIALVQLDKINFFGQTSLANIRLSKETITNARIMQELTTLLPEPSKYHFIDNAVPSIQNN